MQVTTYNQKGEKSGMIELPKELFEVAISPELVYQVAVTQMGNRRQSNAHTKGRGQVSGGGKKPWRQKGTGRARQGSIRSPQWRHGGVVFGPSNEKKYGGKINKKMRRKALAMILSAKAADNSLIIIDSLEIAKPKTREIVRIIDNIKKTEQNFGKGKILIALPALEKNAILASRNIVDVETIEAVKLNVLDLLNSKYLLMPVKAVEDIANNRIKETDEMPGANASGAKKGAKTVKKSVKSASIKK